MALLLLAAVSLALWILVGLDRARGWPGGCTLPSRGTPPEGEEEVVAVVPARNEAALLPRTLPGLLGQGPPLARVILADDRSRDDTGAVARSLADEPTPTVLEVRTIEGLPQGWAGKVHAQEVGVRAAGAAWTASVGHRWLLFTDADIAHPPGLVPRLLARATSGPFDLVSVMARLPAETFWERLLVPAFVYFFQALYPFRRVSDASSPVAAAAGGLVLVRADVLARAGGPSAYRDARIDDLALARRVKDAGGRLWLGLAQDVISIRSYPTLGSIVDMVARSAFTQLRYRLAAVPLVGLGLLLLFVVPLAATAYGLARGDAALAFLGLAGFGLSTLQVLPAYRHHGAACFAVAMPLAAVLYAGMTAISAYRHLRRRPVGWRE